MHVGGLGTACEGGRGARGRCMKGAVPELERLRRDCRRINERTLAQASPCELAEEVWRKTKAESDAGIVGPLRPLEELDLRHVLLARRFGIAQLRDGVRKLRVIDDFRANEAN